MCRLVVLMSCVITLTACTTAPTSIGNQGTPSPAVSPSGPADSHNRFVEVPPNQTQRYSIVAAGIVRVPGMVGAAYNNLRVVEFSQTSGIVKLTFDGYAPPNETRLIVKALASDENEAGGPFVVFFHGFGSDGFDLRVTKLDGSRASLDFVTLDVEVSRYSPAG
jgi:hypothetical protein